MKNIKNAAVLGAGVMGATIAAHLANAGLNVTLLDIVPRELTDAEKDSFRKAFKPVHDEFRDIIGGDLIDAVYELNAKN